MWRFGTVLILNKIRGKEVHQNQANGFKISWVVLLKQIPRQRNGEMSPLQYKIVSFLCHFKESGRAVVIRVSIPLVIFRNGLFCACIPTQRLSIQS